jgi:hypothetical protein
VVRCVQAESRTATAARVLVAVTLAAVALGCAPRPLLERAIRARGGPLGPVVRQVEAEVHAAFPGTWQWRTAFMLPDRYAWTVFTTGEPTHYLFDGQVVRGFVGGREVTIETAPDAPLRSHARFTAVANLDALRLPGVLVAPLEGADLPPGATAGLLAVFPDDGSRYRLGFDAEARLVTVSGPLSLPPLARGELEARFTDFVRVRGFLLPRRTSYRFGAQALAEERALAICPEAPVPEAAFRTPGLLPACVPTE